MRSCYSMFVCPVTEVQEENLEDLLGLHSPHVDLLLPSQRLLRAIRLHLLLLLWIRSGNYMENWNPDKSGLVLILNGQKSRFANGLDIEWKMKPRSKMSKSRQMATIFSKTIGNQDNSIYFFNCQVFKRSLPPPFTIPVTILNTAKHPTVTQFLLLPAARTMPLKWCNLT